MFENIFEWHPLLYKKTYNWKTKAVIHKSYCNFLENIMLFLLAKCEFDGWFHFFSKTRNYKITFP